MNSQKKEQFIITGLPGSGKSTLLKMLSKKGYKILSCDLIVTKLYKKNQAGYKAIQQKWGDKFLDHNGVDKKLLWEGINSQLIGIIDLNQLIHPLIKEVLLKSQFDVCECPIINSNYLFSDQIPTNFKIIKLDVDKNIALQRIMNFKNINQAKAQKLLGLYEQNSKNDVVFSTNNKIDENFVKNVIKYMENN